MAGGEGAHCPDGELVGAGDLRGGEGDEVHRVHLPRSHKLMTPRGPCKPGWSPCRAEPCRVGRLMEKRSHSEKIVIDQAITEGDSKKTHELVAEQLRQRIMNGELEIGERLPPEDELNQHFGIARTTLREALRVLESQGLLEIRRGRGGGPVVTKPDLEPAATALAIALQLEGATVRHLHEVRRMIEPSAAGKLAHEHTVADMAALNQAIGLAEVAAEAHDTRSFGEAAASVHETLLERTANPALSIISQLIHDLVWRYYADRAAATSQEMMKRAVRSYRRLVRYIEDGDVVGATDHWRSQMDFTSRASGNERLSLFEETDR